VAGATQGRSTSDRQSRNNLQPDTAASGNIYPNNSYVPSIEAAAQVLGVKAIDMPFRNAAELERAIDAAVEPNGGLIVLPGAGTATRDTTIDSAAGSKAQAAGDHGIRPTRRGRPDVLRKRLR
jgi:hypothetical protein